MNPILLPAGLDLCGLLMCCHQGALSLCFVIVWSCMPEMIWWWFFKKPQAQSSVFFFFLTADVLIACLLHTEKYKEHYGAITYLWAWADVLRGYCGNFLCDFPYFTFPVHSIRQSQSSFPSSWETNLLILSLLQSISGSLHLHMKPSVFNRAF